MDRTMWLLLGYSSEYGAPTDAVGILGIDSDEDDVETYVRWLPHEYEGARAWRERLESTAEEELPDRLEFWQHDTAALASAVDQVPDHPDLSTAVEIEFHKLLAA